MKSNQFITQIDVFLEEYRKYTESNNASRFRETSQRQRIKTLFLSAILRIAGENSTYSREVDRIVNLKFVTTGSSPHPDDAKLELLAGVLLSLRSELELDYLQSVSELIHGELFADFLQMAEHLLDERYKDAAAVIAGSSLEAHIRQLCLKNSIPVEIVGTGGVKPKKADLMNSELASANCYTKLDQKSVTAWLDLRNKAAHGNYAEYTHEQVAIMISGIRDFIVRNPA